MNRLIYRFYFVYLLIMASIFCVSCKNDKETEAYFTDTLSTSGAVTNQAKDTTEDVYVHVVGEVKKPGVYKVDSKARLYQVIDMAGGFTDKASKKSLNLAKEVQDGEQIEVLSKKQYKQLLKESPGDMEVNSQGEKQYLVNINSASKEQLMELPGIGESKALAIINYREENGAFSSIEDIMLVSGIKESAFSKIKMLITI